MPWAMVSSACVAIAAQKAAFDAQTAFREAEARAAMYRLTLPHANRCTPRPPVDPNCVNCGAPLELHATSCSWCKSVTLASADDGSMLTHKDIFG